MPGKPAQKPSEYIFNRTEGVYRYQNSGRVVPQRQVLAWVRQSSDKAADQMERAARDYLSGKINAAEWALRSAETIRTSNRAAALIGGGGVRSMTPADWGYSGFKIREQLDYLLRFASEVDTKGREGLSPEQFIRRARSYSESVNTTYSGTQARRVARDKPFEFEENVLHPAEHCTECLAQTALGRVALGTLVEIGKRECGPFCKCEIVYSNTKLLPVVPPVVPPEPPLVLPPPVVPPPTPVKKVKVKKVKPVPPPPPIAPPPPPVVLPPAVVPTITLPLPPVPPMIPPIPVPLAVFPPSPETLVPPPVPVPAPAGPAVMTGAEARAAIGGRLAQISALRTAYDVGIGKEYREALRVYYAAEHAQFTLKHSTKDWTPEEKARLDQLNAEVIRLRSLTQTATAEIRKLEEGYDDIMHVSNPATVVPYVMGNPSKQKQETWKRGFEKFGKLVSRDILPLKKEVATHAIKKDRSYHSNGEVYFEPGVQTSIVVHEVGHWLEYGNPELPNQVHQFLIERTANELPLNLKKVTGLNFKKEEVARKDLFMDIYMGKKYEYHDGTIRMTELTSMALQYFVERPAEFAQKDPDMFDFFYDLVRNKFRYKRSPNALKHPNTMSTGSYVYKP
jgi:hypothetical protein